MLRYITNVLIALDVLANAILGGREYQTISSRIGESYLAGGWASKVPWPQWWIKHCLDAIAMGKV